MDESEIKTLNLNFSDVEIVLDVSLRIGIGGDKWPAADQFTSIISDSKWQNFCHKLFFNSSVIELGSGTGLVGILIDKLFKPKSLVITDLESHIPLIQRNILKNNTTNCIVQEFDWFNPTSIGTFDIILALEW